MFRAFELGTVLVKATLGNTSVSYMKPYMIRLVFGTNSFTKFRVCLNKPPIVFVSLNLLDTSTLLTFEVLLNKLLENVRVCEDFPFDDAVLRANRKKLENIGTWFLGKLTTIE
jgi:hypothetical protein